MLAFEIYVNKVKACTAGLDELEYVGATLSSVLKMDRNPDERKLAFYVHGIKDKIMYSWVNFKMQRGHRVEIRIVNAKKTDEPKESKCSGGSCAA
jgi:hypothetical protein